MNEKFELLENDTKQLGEMVLRRIRATKSFETTNNHLIESGQLGGYVQSEDNLSQYGLSWVADDACVCGKARVEDDALVGDQALVSDYAIVRQNAIVYENARLFGHAIIEGSAIAFQQCRIGGHFTISDNCMIYGKARIAGHGTGIIDSAVQIYDYASIFSAYHIKITGEVEIFEFAHITGGCKICDSVKIHGKACVVGNDVRLEDHAEICGEAQVFHSAYIGGQAYVSGTYPEDVTISGFSWICDDAQVMRKEDYRFACSGHYELTFFRNKEVHIIVAHLDERGLRETLLLDRFLTRNRKNKALVAEAHTAKLAMEVSNKKK